MCNPRQIHRHMAVVLDGVGRSAQVCGRRAQQSPRSKRLGLVHAPHPHSLRKPTVIRMQPHRARMCPGPAEYQESRAPRGEGVCPAAWPVSLAAVPGGARLCAPLTTCVYDAQTLALAQGV